MAAFANYLVRGQERARRAGTLERSDSTIEGAIAIVRDLARYLVSDRAKQDWATIEVGDIEAFLQLKPTNRRRRLSACRQFFRWARKNKLVLVDPTRALRAGRRRGIRR